jgi:tetratricopeptide (TPR) repeat protein
MASLISFAPASFLSVICLLSPASAFAALSQQTLAPYAEGLDAMNEGRWPDAVSAFSRALEVSGDDPDIVLARGVARTLAEDFPRALKDLERAQRLGLKGREPQLWIYATEAMSGIIVVPDHALGGGPRSLHSQEAAVVSIPGHVAQGGSDYSSEYGSFIVYQLAMEYQKHRLPADRGGSGNPNGSKTPQMRQALLKAGQLFAELNFRRPELASLNVSRAKQAAGSKTGGNAASVERALAANPADPDAQYLAGKTWLDAGQPASARRAFTIALTLKTDFPDAYVGRATAAARLGDEKRTSADLTQVKKGGWLSTHSTRSAIEDELGNYKVKGSPETFLKELQEAARSGKPFDQLIGIASKLHRVMGEQRLRYDELYQDRLRVLEEAVRDNPKSPDKLVALAAYLIEEADNRGEKVEPRRELQLYRFQESREKELRRAIQLADSALALNANHVGALMQKAVALTALKQYKQADALADQALKLAGNNPDALRLYAKFRAMRANQMSYEAAGLRQERCSSSSHDETRSDGTYRITSTTCYPPSQADVQRAAELDALAAELRRRAKAALETAAKVTKGTVDGFLILADLALWEGHTAEAQTNLEQAVKLDPKSLEAQDRLVQFYAQSGQQEKAEEQRLIAANLIQTTVAPLLRLAWSRTEKTAWEGAKGYLNRASLVDPEDARIPAYLGVVFEGDDKIEDAPAAYRMALALEEARLQLDEPSVPKDKPLGRDALEFGLAIQARFHLAALAEQAGKQADALGHYQAVLGYERRMQRGFESRQMFTAMWPDQKPDKGTVVMAPKNAATLVADAHLHTGKLLSAMGKPDEAIQHFKVAAQYGPLKMAGIPQIGNARGDTNFSGIAGAPAAEAQFYLAKELVAKGDVQGAQKVLYEAGRNLPEHLRGDLNELNMAIARMYSRQPRDPYAGMSAEKRPYVDMQMQQDQERTRMAIQKLAPTAKVLPELVGRWELTPNNKFLPKKTLTIEANADYTLLSVNDGATSKGKMDVQMGRDTGRGRPEPSRGQMMLYDETSGQIGTMWYEFTERDVMEITEMDSTKYRVQRQR